MENSEVTLDTNILILDVETSISHRDDGSTDNSPYHPDNKLVCVGYKFLGAEEVDYPFFHHNELSSEYQYSTAARMDYANLQRALDNADVLVGHNIKFDLKWLRSCGFKYEGTVWDTMICDYVMMRGKKQGLSLQACLERHGILHSKLDIMAEAFKQGINTDCIPLDDLRKYGIQDVKITELLMLAQQEKLDKWGEKGEYVMMAINLMNDFLPTLCDMESSGVAIDIPFLEKLRKEYEEELSVLENKMSIKLKEIMGDQPINLNSPEQKSQVLFSRKVPCKKKWQQVFNTGYEDRNGVRKKKQVNKLPVREFAGHVNKMHTLYKTKAVKCEACKGTGFIHKIKKDGTPWKKPTKCAVCGGTGVEQKLTKEVAGLKLIPRNEFVASAGFATGGDEVEFYLNHKDTSQEAREFLGYIARHNKLTSWTGTFIAQLLKFQHAGVIHPSFNQCITATGRLSCTAPNLQNQPARDPEFKIKKAFISKWADIGGMLTDADFGQLEFRVAAFLSQCDKAIDAVISGLDIHSMTRDFYHGKLEYKPTVIQPDMTRQAAKAETFGPLYGKTTDWTKQFYALFPGIKQWHKQIMEEVATTRELRSPSGRVYLFPDAKRFTRRSDGEQLVSGHTQIKNYTVQGFATGDMVLLVLMDLHNYLKERNAKSQLVLQVHDSATTDTHPDEFKLVEDAYCFAFENVYNHAKERFGIDINVPLAFDLTRGPNWGEQQEIKV